MNPHFKDGSKIPQLALQGKKQPPAEATDPRLMRLKLKMFVELTKNSMYLIDNILKFIHKTIKGEPIFILSNQITKQKAERIKDGNTVKQAMTMY